MKAIAPLHVILILSFSCSMVDDDFVDGQYDDQEALHYSSEDGETSHTLSRSHTVSKTIMGSESTGLGVEIC